MSMRKWIYNLISVVMFFVGYWLLEIPKTCNFWEIFRHALGMSFIGLMFLCWRKAGEGEKE